MQGVWREKCEGKLTKDKKNVSAGEILSLLGKYRVVSGCSVKGGKGGQLIATASLFA